VAGTGRVPTHAICIRSVNLARPRSAARDPQGTLAVPDTGHSQRRGATISLRMLSITKASPSFKVLYGIWWRS
jgi:hypothetical protein